MISRDVTRHHHFFLWQEELQAFQSMLRRSVVPLARRLAAAPINPNRVCLRCAVLRPAGIRSLSDGGEKKPGVLDALKAQFNEAVAKNPELREKVPIHFAII
jgi:hypothetical protein